jgi:hypothetical protein
MDTIAFADLVADMLIMAARNLVFCSGKLTGLVKGQARMALEQFAGITAAKATQKI